jgi:hypothetical protein
MPWSEARQNQSEADELHTVSQRIRVIWLLVKQKLLYQKSPWFFSALLIHTAVIVDIVGRFGKPGLGKVEG